MTTTVPGVDPTTGLLTNPEAYFWHLTGRAPNQPADDYADVLRACGLPAGYPPYSVPHANGFYGLTQQIGSDGRIAGRIFLPTQVADELGYYSAPVSPLKDAPTPGHLLWEWRPLGGPPYEPWITEPANGGEAPPPPDEGELTARVDDLEARVTAIESVLVNGLHAHGPIDLPVVLEVEGRPSLRCRGDIDVAVKPGEATPPSKAAPDEAATVDALKQALSTPAKRR